MPWTARVEPPALESVYLRPLLDCLVQINLIWRRTNPRASRLYDSGVVYRREPRGQERWLSVPKVLARGFGDCEDLACWLVSDLIFFGGDPGARPFHRSKQTDRGMLYHILVKRSDGTLEDPSKKLGM